MFNNNFNIENYLNKKWKLRNISVFCHENLTYLKV